MPSSLMRSRLMSHGARAAFVIALLSPGAAFAQDAARELEEVIITAQKRAESLNDVPVSVTAVSGEKLAVIRSSGGDIRVFSARIPSVTLESSFGRTFPRPYIRGLGNTDFDLNASQPVSFVYDDVVLENPVLKGFPLFDIEQVEALRGPQGTLFGRNTPAGVLKFDSAKPTQQVSGYGQFSYATFGTINAEGAVGGPIIDGVLTGRISGLYQHRNDWVDNGFTGQKDATGGYDETAVRGQLLFTPNEAFSALFNAHYMKLDGTPQIFRANIIAKGTNDFVPGFKRGVVFQDAESRATQIVEASGASLKMTYDLGGPELTSITAYEHVTAFSRGDIDGGFSAVFAPPSGPGLIPFSAESADGMPYHAQWSQELRLAGEAGALNYTVGAFYFFEDVKIDSINYDTLGGGVRNGLATQHQKTKSWAIFGNVDYPLSEQWTIGGGLRYSDDSKEFEARQYIAPPFAPSPPGVLRASPESDEISFNLNTTYAVTPDVNLYARIAKGYRAPSIQGRLLFGSTISVADKETLMSYEAGFKADLFDRRARIDANVFFYKVDDLQLTAVGGGANFNQLINAAKAEGYGFEFNGEAAPTENLLLTAGLSYNHTEIQDPNLFTQPCGGGCTVLDPAGPIAGTVRLDGNSLPNAPRWIANVTARYAIPYGEGEFFVFTDWAYRSKVNFFLYESAEFTDKKLLEGGLRLGYAFEGGRYEAALFGRNITNDKSLEGGIDFNNLTGFVNDPRTLGFEVKAKF